jgi:methyl-accepting chemotaxis protein
MALQDPMVDGAELDELHERLKALEEFALGGLEHALRAMADGDFTRRVVELPEPVLTDSGDARVRALVDLFNAMLQRTRSAFEAQEQLRGDLARALGDRSCLVELQAALISLDEHCLTDLDRGLHAMADGDLTLRAQPVTKPLRPLPGDSLGGLGEVFNDMLARSRTALRSYDALREDLRVLLGDRSCLDDVKVRLQSLQRHCLRDLEEALEAAAEGTTLTRKIAPATLPIEVEPGAEPGELAGTFNRALARARAGVEHLVRWRQSTEL